MQIVMVEKEHADDLMHYGVLGMKWGVHRATRKASSNERLQKKALEYDKKAGLMTKKSEKIHAKKDLEAANRKAVKAAKYSKKASALEKKSINATGDLKQARLHKKSENLKYKAANLRRDANRISKSKGYGVKAMKYSIKSDRAAALAAKARKKIAYNEYYIQRMKKKASQVSNADLQNGYRFVNRLQSI